MESSEPVNNIKHKQLAKDVCAAASCNRAIILLIVLFISASAILARKNMAELCKTDVDDDSMTKSACRFVLFPTNR